MPPTMMWHQVVFCFSLLLLGAVVDGSSLQRTTIASASIQRTMVRRYPTTSSPIHQQQHHWGTTRRSRSNGSVLLAARRSRQAVKEDKGTNNEATKETASNEGTNNGRMPIRTYADLSLPGKILAGIVEISVVTVFDYVGGFVVGYFGGTAIGVPGLFFGKGPDGPSASLMQASLRRLQRMHQRSARWGRTWGGVSAVGAASGVAARIVRGGVQDEWTTVLSSMAMGAFFSRADGPAAMVRGAILYGALVKLLSGGMSSKKAPGTMDFRDETVEDF